ncbi:MAG TPA: MFS transporter, partial [Acidimicrobiales bacterium]|nr:MFS transporter [Acidimicrobiales bacterium]
MGPLAGGFLLSHFYWGSVFFVNLPIVAVVIVGAYWLVPESRHPLAPRQDPIGALLSMAGLGIVLWGVIEAPSHGWGSTPILVALTVGVATLAGFVAWELNCSSPMLDIGFFKNPRFTAASASITVMFFTLFGSLFVLTQYLQSVLGFGTLKAGAAVVPMAAAMMVVSPVSGGFVQRLGNRIVVTFGVVVVAVAMALLTRLGVHAPMWQPMGVAAVIGLGMGAAFGPATASLMGSVPRERAGVGSAMNDTTRQVGGAVGVAVFGSVLASRYHATVVRAAGLNAFPASVAGGIRNDVGSAVRFAHSGHAGVFAAAAASVARQGFVSALHAVALVGVVVMLV